MPGTGPGRPPHGRGPRDNETETPVAMTNVTYDSADIPLAGHLYSPDDGHLGFRPGSRSHRGSRLTFRVGWDATRSVGSCCKRVSKPAGRSAGSPGTSTAWPARWRSACIGVGVRARYLAGHMADDGFAARLLTSAEPGAAGSRVVLAEAARDALRAAGL